MKLQTIKYNKEIWVKWKAVTSSTAPQPDANLPPSPSTAQEEERHERNKQPSGEQRLRVTQSGLHGCLITRASGGPRPALWCLPRQTPNPDPDTTLPDAVLPMVYIYYFGRTLVPLRSWCNIASVSVLFWHTSILITNSPPRAIFHFPGSSPHSFPFATDRTVHGTDLSFDISPPSIPGPPRC